MRKLSWALGILILASLHAGAAINGTFIPTSGSQTWNTGTNWDTNPNFPNGTGDSATFNTPTANETVSLGQGITVGSISLTNNNTFTFTLANGTGGSLTMDASAGDASITVNGTGNVVNTISASVSLTDTVDITVNDTATTSSSGALAISGSMGGSGGLNKLGAGTLSLTSTTKAYTGATDIQGGILRLTGPGQPTATSSVTVENGAQLRFDSGSSQTFSLGLGTITLNGAGISGSGGALRQEPSNTATVSNNINLATASTIFVTSSSGTMLLNGNVSGSGRLTKDGAGTLTISSGSTNSSTGGTSILAGILSVTADAQLGAVPVNPSDNITIDGGRLEITGVNQTINANRNILLGATAGTSISAKAGSGTVTYNGTLKDLNGSTSGILAKQGADTLVLGGNNTFTGGTFVNNGTLNAAGTGALGSGTSGTSSITVASGATLVLSNTSVTDRARNDAPVTLSAGTGTPGSGGRLNAGQTADTTSTSETLGPATLNNNATIDFASTNGSHFELTLSGTSTLNATSANYVQILDWDGTVNQLGISGSTDRLLFANGVTGFTNGSTTNQILFNIGGQLYNTEFLTTSGSGLEAVAFQTVPEPGALAFVLSGFGLLVINRRIFRRR